MNLVDLLYTVGYYKFWNTMLPKMTLSIPEELKNSMNIFIYFDYEREYGGHNTLISNNDVENVLLLLNKLKIATSWFTVGKVIDEYPDTISKILDSGHEIGSHSYSHISPLDVSRKRLSHDFRAFSKVSPKGVEIHGFHSPRGRWSFRMLNQLRLHNYSYDVIGANKKERLIPYMVGNGKTQLIRLHTVGDDWPLYNKNLNKEDILRYFYSHLYRLKPGEIAGIGFHPWILFSDPNILTSFSEFLTYMKEQKNIRLETGSYYTDLLLSEQEGLHLPE